MGTFALGGASVAPTDLRAWDSAGSIVWTTPNTREWLDQSFPDLPAGPGTTGAGVSPKKKIVLISSAIGLVAACGLCGLVASLSPSPSGPPDQPVAKQQSKVATTASAPARKEATATSQPASQSPPPIQEPAAQAAPPAPVALSPAQAARKELAETLGTFPVVKKSGRGDGVVKLPRGFGVAMVSATHKGSSNFAIQVLDSDNSHTDLLVNDIGRYSGTTLLEDSNASAAKLKVTADGRWTIKVAPVPDRPSV